MTQSRIRIRKLHEWVTAYSFLLPNIAGLFIFVFIPILYAFYVSLHQWNALSPKVFIGFENYVNLWEDEQWWDSVVRTLWFSLIYVPLLFVSALFSALLIHSLKGKMVTPVRTMFLMPFAVTSVISAIIGMFLLDPRNGIVNQILNRFGFESQPFLGSPSQAVFCIIIVILWINLGYNMIIFLSAIKEIPKDYYEAAHIDGATGGQTLRYITFPLLKETNTFILIVSTIGSFQIFDQIMVMTKGGPANATEVSVLYIFKQGFQMLNMGYSSALAFVLFLIIFSLSLIQLRWFSSKD